MSPGYFVTSVYNNTSPRVQFEMARARITGGSKHMLTFYSVGNATKKGKKKTGDKYIAFPVAA